MFAWTTGTAWASTAAVRAGTSACGSGDCVFVEDRALAPFAERLEQLVVFRWNRVYPGDRYLDLDLAKGPWRKTEEQDFPGKSHERITMEVYTR